MSNVRIGFLSAAFLALTLVSLPSKAAIIGYNYVSSTDENCTVNGVNNPCFVRGMFNLDSDQFTLAFPPGQVIEESSIMFELVSKADGTVLDTAGPIGERFSLNHPDGTFSFLSIVSQGPDDVLVRMTNQGWQWLTAVGKDLNQTLIDAGSNIDPSITPKVVPLPAAAWMFLTALGGLGLFGWRRRREISTA